MVGKVPSNLERRPVLTVSILWTRGYALHVSCEKRLRGLFSELPMVVPQAKETPASRDPFASSHGLTLI